MQNQPEFRSGFRPSCDCQLVKLDAASSLPRITATAAGCKALWSATAKARRGSSRSFLRPSTWHGAPFGKQLALPRVREVYHHVGDARRGASLISSSASRPRLSGCPSAHQPTPMMVVGATGAEPAWAAEPVNAPRAGAKRRRKMIKAIHRLTREATVASLVVGL